MAASADKFPLLDYLDELVDDLRDLAPRAAKGNDADAVHDARVATRRLKAALELMQEVVSRRHAKPLDKLARSLRKRLGLVRDLDVMLAHLEKIKSARHESAIKWMQEILEPAREKAVAKAGEDLQLPKVLARLGCWWGLREEILAARETIPSLLSESVHLQLDAFLERIDPLSDPHQLRITGKSLRYTLEMAKAQKLPLPRQALSHFKKLQDALGLWHDDVVLAERIMCESVDAMLAHHDAPLQQTLLSLAASMTRRAQHQIEKVSETWKKEGDELTRQIRDAFPLTQPAPEPSLPFAQPAAVIGK